MGIRGYVQVKQPEYGNCCLSSWVADQCERIMEDNGVAVYRHYGDDEIWEIKINNELKSFVKKLEKNTKMLDKYLSGDLKGNGYGEDLLALLKEGIDATEKENMSFIIINWF